LLFVQEQQKELNDYFYAVFLAGNRNTTGGFNNRSFYTYIWSSVESGGNAWKRNLNSGNATVNRNTNNKANGFSVRCLKNWLICRSRYFFCRSRESGNPSYSPEGKSGSGLAGRDDRMMRDCLIMDFSQ
jgi:hypothetical protein